MIFFPLVGQNKGGCYLLVQITFSSENYYVAHTSKKNNLWFWMSVSTPVRWLTATQSPQTLCSSTLRGVELQLT